MLCPSAIEVPVPPCAVLVGEAHERAVGRGAGRPPRLGEQHEREQPEHLGLVRHQIREQAGEADRLGTELVAHEVFACRGEIALVEHEVHHGQHRPRRSGSSASSGTRYGIVVAADLVLRAHETLSHRRLGDEEGAGDLVRAQSGHEPERQRDLRARRRARGGSR